jgi:hypothetical protein
MRFHHLADAVVVLDEVQAFPCVLWEPLQHAVSELTQLGSTHILAMSATQPGFLPGARELIDRREEFFGRMNRYRIVLRHRSPMGLSAFVEECRGRLAGEWAGQRVMLTLNTRGSARRVREALAADAERLGFRVEFLTADERASPGRRRPGEARRLMRHPRGWRDSCRGRRTLMRTSPSRS